MPRPGAETREHILEVARELFYWSGIRATGVDRVAAEAGVSPTTLYRHFASKDDLVAAYVEREGRGYRAWFDEAVSRAGDPGEQLVALFAALAEQTDPARCRGCPFQMALTETPDGRLGANRHARATKAWVRERLGELAAGVPGAEDPTALADHLMLLMEGVYASAGSLGAQGPARRAEQIVARLVAPAR